jgi:hypothetical protein
VSHLLELVEEADRNRDGKIDFDEWEIMGKLDPPAVVAAEYSPGMTSQADQENNTHVCEIPRESLCWRFNATSPLIKAL